MPKHKKRISLPLLLLLLLLLFFLGAALYFILSQPAPANRAAPAPRPVVLNAPAPAINAPAALPSAPMVTFSLPPRKQLPPAALPPPAPRPAPETAPVKKPAPAAPAPAARAATPPEPARAAAPSAPAAQPARRAISAGNTQFIVRRKLLAGGQIYTNGADTLAVPARYYIECAGTTDMQTYYFEVDPAAYQGLQTGLMYHVAKTSGWQPLAGLPANRPPPPGYTRVR